MIGSYIKWHRKTWIFFFTFFTMRSKSRLITRSLSGLCGTKRRFHVPIVSVCKKRKEGKTTEKKAKEKERKGEKKGEGVSSPFEGSHEANAVLLRKIGLEFRLERPPLCKTAFRKIGLGFLRFVPRNLIG
jgi:hypothetical protein